MREVPIQRFLRALYDCVEVFMATNNLEVLDAMCAAWIFDETNKEGNDIDRTLGLFTATLPVRSKLPSRKILLDEAKIYFVKENKSGYLWEGLD
jgi:hypothetical protein